MSAKTLDAGILEVLASKICHDLISPIGAVNNGIEFMEEMGADAGSEAVSLVAFSAQQASAKLQAFRMAYGVGGADSNIKPEDVHKVIDLVVSADNKIKQDWNPHAKLQAGELPRGFCKMLICTILLAMECLPKGGTILVAGSDGGGTAVIARGENANIRGQTLEALDLTINTQHMDPKYVHAYMTGQLALYHGFKIAKSASGEGFVSFEIKPA